jgi:hypothetical protein
MSQDGTGKGDVVVPTGPAERPGDVDPETQVRPSNGSLRIAPREELPLDPRAIARASLLAGRNPSLWWIAGGVAIAAAVAVIVGTPAGALVLAGLLAVGAVVRAAAPDPGPAALSVRTRALDVLILFGLAFALALLTELLPKH